MSYGWAFVVMKYSDNVGKVLLFLTIGMMVYSFHRVSSEVFAAFPPDTSDSTTSDAIESDGDGFDENGLDAELQEQDRMAYQRDVAVTDLSALDADDIGFSSTGLPQLGSLQNASMDSNNESFVVNKDNYKFVLTLDPQLQKRAQELLKQSAAPWGAVVAIEVRTGRVLALADYSKAEPEKEGRLATQALFPAASLFKLVTAAAAIEQEGLELGHRVNYRGGDYVLNKGNYLPDERRDNRYMSFSDALGKSCNPVFARIALNWLSEKQLSAYAHSFGFNSDIHFDMPLGESTFSLDDDVYAFARTAAGFGNVRISPLHAAVLTGAIANQGTLMRPFIVERVENTNGESVYQVQHSVLKRAVLPWTADRLMKAMEHTISVGTAKRQFKLFKSPMGAPVHVAGKTGTLRGTNPDGISHWFVATAPVEDPEIAIASLVVDNGDARVNGLGVGRRFIEYYFND